MLIWKERNRCPVQWLRDQGLRALEACDGQDLAEYAMLAALIVVVCIVAMVALGGTLATLWGNITAAFAALP